MGKLFKKIKPYNEGFLQVSRIHKLHYEEVGNPCGKPVIFLHGGPGVGILPVYRRFFDPKFYRIILLDQRGCGKSKPFLELKENSTWELVEDLEKLRKHLGIKKWIITGGSWGSTLGLCYAIKHSRSIKGIILRGIFLGRLEEILWLHKKGANNIYPDEWEKYTSVLNKNERKDIVKAYYNKIKNGNKKEKIKFANLWSAWETSIMNIKPDKKEIEKLIDEKTNLSIGLIESYYTKNNFFLPSDNWILDNAKKINKIPMILVQGRFDIIAPMKSAWELHKFLSKSKLVIVQNGAHSPDDSEMVNSLIIAQEEFKKLWK